MSAHHKSIQQTSCVLLSKEFGDMCDQWIHLVGEICIAERDKQLDIQLISIAMGV